MKLGAIYNFFVKEGIAVDVRSSRDIAKKLAKTKLEYKKLPQSKKRFFDRARFSNPYSDTRILHGKPSVDVKNILVGIDIESGELLLTDRLRKKGKKIDLVLGHHPEGIALAGLYEVMGLQIDILEQLGLAPKVASSLMQKRMQEVERRLHSGNHDRVVDAAKLLDIPFMCCHTPADNHVVSYLQKKIYRKKSKTLKNLIDMLLLEPEFQHAAQTRTGPKILVGSPKDKVGKVMVDMTGGTEGSKEVFARISQAGINTIVCMHLSEAHFNKVKSEHINVVVAGHIASDVIGVNLLLDKLERLQFLNVFKEYFRFT